MYSFLTKKEKKISKEFEQKGFVISDIKDKESLKKIRKIFIETIKKTTKLKKQFKNDDDLLNFIHKKIKSQHTLLHAQHLSTCIHTLRFQKLC